nr:MAG TPA: hypothetical protein [Caudoviricetes sp.]
MNVASANKHIFYENLNGVYRTTNGLLLEF